MMKGSKPELVALEREDRHDSSGVDLDDGQYNGLMFPRFTHVVFFDIGMGEIGAVYFTSAENATGWAHEKMLGMMKGEKI